MADDEPRPAPAAPDPTASDPTAPDPTAPDPTAPTLSVQLRLTGRPCLVVGGGRVATRRADALLAVGAQVLVVAPEPSPRLLELATTGALELRRRDVRDGDVVAHGPDRPALVVVATDRAEVNAAIGALAAAAGILVNRADDVTAGDVAFPATVHRGPLQVALSARPAAPAVTRWAAERLEATLDDTLGLDAAGLERLVEVVAEVRRELRPGGSGSAASTTAGERGVTDGAVDWRSALDGSILDLIHQGRTAEAKERLLACLSS